MKTKPLNGREIAAALAGLRLPQDQLATMPAAVREIYNDAGAGLSADEIDALCARLNMARFYAPGKAR